MNRTCLRRTDSGLICGEPANKGDCGRHDRASKASHRVHAQTGPGPSQGTQQAAAAAANTDPFGHHERDPFGTPAVAANGAGGRPGGNDTWPPHLDELDVEMLAAEGVTPEQASWWPANRILVAQDVTALQQSGLDPSHLEPWPDHLSGWHIVTLIEAGVDPDEAARWPDRFNGDDIALMARKGVDPDYAATWSDDTTAATIVILYRYALEPAPADT